MKIIFVALFGILLLAGTGCSSLRPLFEEEVKKENAKYQNQSVRIITEEDIASLPVPIQKYLRVCNYVGKEAMWNSRIEWKTANIKRAQDGDWMPLECVQYNFVPSPARIVYLNASMWGIIPFDGRDKYQDGAGNMYIRVMNTFVVENATGKEMDQSSLVTILAEAMMVPSYALQKYIQWKSIDSLSAEGTLTYNGMSVSGFFYFNELGEYIRFETKDRFHSEGDVHNNYPWIIHVSDYKDFGGFKQPAVITATWITDKGEYQYWKGEIGSIKYNVDK